MVLVKGNLQQLVLSSDIERLLGLEGCLSGNVPAKRAAGRGRRRRAVRAARARAKTVKVVFGPGTFLNEAAERIDEQLDEQSHAARSAAPSRPERSSTAPRSRAGSARAQARALGQQARQGLAGRNSSRAL